MPTKLPTQAIDTPQALIRSQAPNAKWLEAKRLGVSYQSTLQLLLRRCFAGAMFTLILPSTIVLSSGAALAQADTDGENTRHNAVQPLHLLAQQVIDGLPPPPPIPDLQIPDGADLPLGSGPQTGSQEDTGKIFIVYVNGDSPLLLDQVQQVAPTARIQNLEGQQVILAGLFDQSSKANEQIEQLDQRGIDANVASVSSVVLSPNAPSTDVSTAPSTSTGSAGSVSGTQVPRASLDELPPADPIPALAQANPQARPGVSVAPPSVPSSSPATTVTNTPRQDNAYYVVIPGNENELGALWEQVVLLGAVSNAVEQRDRPLGPHLLIGPFVNQDAATRWNRYFQDFGMDARVYYKR